MKLKTHAGGNLMASTAIKRIVHFQDGFLLRNVCKFNTLKRCFFQTTLNPFEERPTEIIDVRTEKEFFIDHIPGAINCPVLHQEEHQHVGKQYSQNAFQARKTGAKLVSSNISKHIDTYFQHKDESYSPLVYCWRGGQRSRSLGIILAEIGFNVFVLEGGYKTYRKVIREQLETLPSQMIFNVLSGLTGTGKTFLLQELSRSGEQVLDLEGLANHKGSLLGLENNTQPSQKYWETLLRERLAGFTSDRPVWVESESRQIGNVTIPTKLFQRMCEGKRYQIVLPMEERVKHIIKDYPYWVEDIEELKKTIGPLERYRGKKKVQHWNDLISDNRIAEFVESMLRDHYDPTYTLSQSKSSTRSGHTEEVHLDCLDKLSVDRFIHDVLKNS